MATEEQTPRNGSAQSGSNVANQNNSVHGASSFTISVPHFGSTLNQPFSLKLDRNNFSLRKTMVMAIARVHQLDGYLTGARSIPEEFLPASDAEGQPKVGSEINPEFEQWIVNDQLLTGWLYGSMTEGIATEVMGCSSLADLWSGLEALFGAHSKAKMDAYRTKIQTIRKGSMNMAKYLKQNKQWADVLALAGDPYPQSHLVSNVLSRLDTEYLPIVLQIEVREKTTRQTLQGLLLSFDSKLDIGTNRGSPTANLTNRGTSGGGNFGPRKNRGRGGTINNSNNHGRSGGRGRGCRGGPKPTCQVCGSYGHSAAHCYNLYDEAYMGTTPPRSSNDNNKIGKSVPTIVATLEMLQADAWYTDSGASNHITFEAGNINQKTKYYGKDSLVVGDGNKLSTKHIYLVLFPQTVAIPLLLGYGFIRI
ncbi:hypothetical protein CsatA_004028 [Cannabis sativa]